MGRLPVKPFWQFGCQGKFNRFAARKQGQRSDQKQHTNENTDYGRHRRPDVFSGYPEQRGISIKKGLSRRSPQLRPFFLLRNFFFLPRTGQLRQKTPYANNGRRARAETRIASKTAFLPIPAVGTHCGQNIEA